MSVTKEIYIIFGLKLDEKTTKVYWDMDFFDELEWCEDKPKDKPFFLSDGMSGNYTFFGFIQQLNSGYDTEENSVELQYDFDKSIVISEFSKLFPNIICNEFDVKLFYVPHYC